MTAGPRQLSLASLVGSVRTLASFGRDLSRVLGALREAAVRLTPASAPSRAESAAITDAMRRAGDAHAAGRVAEAESLYRDVVGRAPAHVGALRGLRDLAVARRDWREALDVQHRLVGAVPTSERAAESTWLATIHYERGRAELIARRVPAAVVELRHAVRADHRFTPAVLALGDALEASGDLREAVRVWERAAEREPSVSVLARLERVYRAEGRPSRMIALYRTAVERAPNDLAVAIALGRVYFELEMLDQAADQFEKTEVRAPDVPTVHAFLGAVFERRGDAREAFDEYRRALRLAQAFTWPHRCAACRATTPTWEDRCPGCGQWNTLAPVAGT